MQDKSAFWQGARAAGPVLPGVIPFAMVTGAMVIEQGHGLLHALGFSIVIFAGASQLTILTLANEGAPALVMVLTALAINLRMTLYSAVMAPWYAQLKFGPRALLAYLMTDQAFMLTGRYVNDHKPALAERFQFYLGVALALWTTWQLGTLAGVLLGHGVPPAWALDFTVPLSFLALLVPAVRTKPALGAAVAAAVAYFWTRHLPLHSGIIGASIIGILTGVWLERRNA